MLRTLITLLALLSLTTSASSAPPTAPPSEHPSLLFATPHTDNRLLQSLGVNGSPLSTPPAQA